MRTTRYALQKMALLNSELILNTDGSIYHLNLLPEQVAPIVFTVGDPSRVAAVSKYFDRIEDKVSHREFVSHIGELRGQRVMCISTGIGTDNIDIVLNELDALVNIDFTTREVKPKLTPLSIFRIGTSGAIQETIALDSFIITELAIGFDNLMHYYDATPSPDGLMLSDALADYLEQKNDEFMILPYGFEADKTLLAKFDPAVFQRGITVTAPGFYAPQGRILRGRSAEPKLLKWLTLFKSKNKVLTNLEMETAGIYGMARLLNHRAVSVSAILANRATGTFSSTPEATVERLIEQVLAVVV
jgi:uridine phosphorylase